MRSSNTIATLACAAALALAAGQAAAQQRPSYGETVNLDTVK